MPNATCIYLYEGERAPVVFDTALVARERRSLQSWLIENPDLDALVRQALALVEREAERTEPPVLRELADQQRRGALLHVQALADLQDVLACVVAAREEQALGEHEQAATILADLEADLVALVERAAP